VRILPGRSSRSLAGRDLLVTLGVAALYLWAAKLGLAFSFQAQQVSAVWPPTGLALAATLWFGRPALAGVFLGAFVANLTSAEPAAVAAGIALGNTLEALAGVALLRWAGFDGRLARLRDAAAMLGAAAASPLVAASIGIASLGLGGVQPADRLAGLWWVWWLGDALGALVIAPALLAWTGAGAGSLPRRQWRRWRRWRPWLAAESAALLGGILAASTLFFLGRYPVARVSEYAFFPLLFWAALRFGPAATATVTAIAYAVASAATVAGFGPFAGAGPERGLVFLQLFMAVTAATGLVLGSVAAQRRSAEQSARTNEARLLLALRSARMGVWDWTISTGEVAWSEGEALPGGPAAGSFQGSFEALRRLVHPDDLERVDRVVGAAVEHRSPFETEFRLRAGGGSGPGERWIAVRGQALEDDAGRPLRMVGVELDVTERKRLEQELRQKAELLAESDRRKNEFLAMLAHELRNPLAPILHAVDLLEGGETGPRAERWREVIRRQTRHLTRIVDDLLDIARITRGAVKVERRRVLLSEAVAAGVENCEPLASGRRQDLSIELPRQPIWLDADPTRLAQVVSNLLHNAVKFTPEGGRIELSAALEDGWAVVRIRDSGAGMSPEVLASAFDLFAQGGAPLDRTQGGLGLGLTLVRRLVELHGGTVTAASEGPGRGSELVVRLPAVAAAAATAEPARAAASGGAPLAAGAIGGPGPDGGAPAPARRVLVVDDNVDALESLTTLLRIDGHEVRAAADGPGALAEAEHFRPEIVLLDLGLPGLDGYAVASALRELPGCDRALLVAVTGYGQSEDVARSRAAGIDHHLVKPVEPSRIREMVRRSSVAAAD
jgi:signal transduction histidine kinase/integral membrane sensor domain MASE1/ActR/RegA family two-component response regulator